MSSSEFFRLVGNVLEVAGTVVGKTVRVRVEAIEAATESSDPEGAGGILEQGPDEIVAQGMGIVGVMLVHRKAIAVILVEPVFGAEPQKTLAVLQDAVYRAMG
jgi:hypothetical protein